MKFRDKYPRKCSEYCPVCKLPCMQQFENHTDGDGNWTAHVCGPHWWVRFNVGGHVMKMQGHFSEAIKNAQMD